ncbi:hypothetical protein YC2023_017286 [Brassica napus]
MINMLKQDTRKDGIEAGNTQRSHLHAFGEDVRSLGVLLICNVMNKLSNGVGDIWSLGSSREKVIFRNKS